MSVRRGRGPHNRRTHTHKRTLPILLCVVALGLGLSVGWSQPVPDTILLPDSLGPLRLGYHVAFGSSTDNIYVASETADIMVVDGNTFQRIKRINTGTPVGGVLLVSQHNKLYCLYPQQGRIGVIDCATNNVVRTIDVGTRPTLLCYSSGSDKLYCGDTIDGTVTVIDCAADTVCRVIPVGRSLRGMAYDPTTSKVYAATRDGVRAISCSADSIVANIAAVKSSKGLYVNKRRQKLYAKGPAVSHPDTIYVISTVSDSVIARVEWWYGGPLQQMACNEATDRLYSVSDNAAAMLELDCVGDTLLRVRPHGSDKTLGPVCDSARNRLYFLLTYDGHGYLDEVDCATLDVISRTRLGENHAVLDLDPGRCRVMCGGDGMWLRGAELAVFDCKSDSLRMRAVVPLCGWYTLPGQRVLCHNPVSRKFYYRWGNSAGGLGVIDEQTNKVVRRVILPQWISQSDLVYCRTGNKLYCGSDPGVAVVDGAGDSLLKFVNLVDNTAQNLAWCPDYNKLYCTGNGGLRWYMAVMDCYTDSVIKEIEFYDFPGRPVYIGRGRLLYSYGHRLALIDCRNDSVLVDTNMGSNVDAVGHTGDGKKVYIVHAGRVEVLDGSSLSLLATIDWTYGAPRGYNSFLMCSDTTDKLYWFVVGGGGVEPDSVLAIDTHTDTVVARLGAGYGQEQGCFDYSGRYIFNLDGTFAPDPWDNSLIIYDTQLDNVAAVYKDLPAAPLAAVLNPEERCIYVACSDVVLVYPDAPPGVEEAMSAERGVMNAGPSIVRRVLFLPPAQLSSTSVLLSADGRKVMDLEPGANDVRALAPGVYFIRQGRGSREQGGVGIRKVVVTR